MDSNQSSSRLSESKDSSVNKDDQPVSSDQLSVLSTIDDNENRRRAEVYHLGTKHQSTIDSQQFLDGPHTDNSMKITEDNTSSTSLTEQKKIKISLNSADAPSTILKTNFKSNATASIERSMSKYRFPE